MPRIGQLAAFTGAAALALTAVGTPAYAGATEIREYVTGNPYSGPAKGTLVGNLSVDGGLVGTTTCTTSVLNGNVDSDGNPMTITSASVSGCSGLASSITFNTPWNGRINYTGGGTAVLELDDFEVQATVKIGFINVNCVYGGAISVTGSNGSPAGAPATIDMAGTQISKTGGNILCPSPVTITEGTFELTGGGGEILYVTGTYP